jgi:hypothetical protein
MKRETWYILKLAKPPEVGRISEMCGVEMIIILIKLPG